MTNRHGELVQVLVCRTVEDGRHYMAIYESVIGNGDIMGTIVVDTDTLPAAVRGAVANAAGKTSVVEFVLKSEEFDALHD